MNRIEEEKLIKGLKISLASTFKKTIFEGTRFEYKKDITFFVNARIDENDSTEFEIAYHSGVPSQKVRAHVLRKYPVLSDYQLEVSNWEEK